MPGIAARKFARLAALAAALSTSACGSLDRGALLPDSETKQVSVLGIANGRFIMDEATPVAMIEEFKQASQRERDCYRGLGRPLPPANFLALSGGSDNGAFGAGLLVGWSARGTRPTFKGVTGTSTGALIAPFAFLGPDYDPQLTEVFTTITQDDILKKRPLLIGLTSDAAADSTPLLNLISRHLDEQMLAAIAREYRRGRLLFIGTTDLDAGRQVIWNIGAIAESGHPDALNLTRRILLASASIPGAFPPVMLDISHDGAVYQELHVDGGAVAQAFLYPESIEVRKLAVRQARTRTAYIIRNGRRWEGQDEVKRQTLSVSERAISVLIDSNAVGDMYRIYATTKRDGVGFNLAFIEDDFTAPHPGPFDRDYMNKLFDYGRAKARAGYKWYKAPPGFADGSTSVRVSKAVKSSPGSPPPAAL